MRRGFSNWGLGSMREWDILWRGLIAMAITAAFLCLRNIDKMQKFWKIGGQRLSSLYF